MPFERTVVGESFIKNHSLKGESLWKIILD